MTSELVISGSSDHSMKIVDVEKMQEVRTILTKDSITTSIDYASDRILSCHEDGYIRLWDIRDTKNPTTTYKSHSKFASCVKFNRNSSIFASVNRF
jgi:WD40 repeat protein